jgi:Flp pilus assembly protein TadG
LAPVSAPGKWEGKAMFGGNARSAMPRAWTSIIRLAREKRGIAAVEFALIAPLLLGMYFLTLEVSQGIEANKKIARVGSMVADLITQQQTIGKSELDAIMKIGGSIMQPYGRTNPKIVITAIDITPDPNSKVQVAWSRKMIDGVASADAAKNTITTVPTALNIKGSFLIRVESFLDYRPLITWTAGQKQVTGLTGAFDSIAMKETYYLRPRMSTSIVCSDC